MMIEIAVVRGCNQLRAAPASKLICAVRSTGGGCRKANGESPFVSMMRLITAHRILIATALVFFVFFAFWEYRNYLRTDNGWAVFRAVLYLLVAVCFGVYFQKVKQWYK